MLPGVRRQVIAREIVGVESGVAWVPRRCCAWRKRSLLATDVVGCGLDCKNSVGARGAYVCREQRAWVRRFNVAVMTLDGPGTAVEHRL